MSLLHRITWTSYLEFITFLLVIYYIMLGIRFFAGDISQLYNRICGNKPVAGNALPAALMYGEPEAAAAAPAPANSNYDGLPDDSMAEADELIGKIKQIILAAADKPFAPAVLIPQLKKLFRGHVSLKTSPHRPAINELVVSECERTGVAGLTEDEADEWWSG
ncbi:hypothetical protein [Mucilaginibacter sp.]|uniref:hypothetical protein n=1 Tax=Mucilaginibacter sp. TaxID=1882438 RepID=UPI00260E2D17|nr:hypothetical protein [Mucilaginibacter sp.]MDB4921836.1 hypothetical protein [Mucilaginibacter sp.]